MGKYPRRYQFKTYILYAKARQAWRKQERERIANLPYVLKYL